MRNILMVCAICLVLAVGNALPNNRGVGAFAYQDSSGNRFPIFNFPSPGFTDEQFPAMQNYPNQFGAFAGAAAGPGFSHQVASINPPNPNMPNVNKYTSYSGAQPNDGNQFVSVSSSSYSSSVNDNGEVKNHRAAETVVNNNGKVTKYKVEN